jgi:hypothetical protein
VSIVGAVVGSGVESFMRMDSSVCMLLVLGVSVKEHAGVCTVVRMLWMGLWVLAAGWMGCVWRVGTVTVGTMGETEVVLVPVD